MLDGAEPNEHHLTLAKLAKEKHITGIVTTNFDTLIEQAFEIQSEPNKKSSPEKPINNI